MESVVGSISPRETASAVWLGVLVVFLVANRPTRGSLAGVLKALFRPILIAPFAIAALYAAIEIVLLARIGWWSVANLKITLLWLVTFAFVTMFELATAKDRKSGFGRLTREIVSITGILLFVTELHSFPFLVELIFLPIVTFVALTAEVAKREPRHAPVARLLGCTTNVLGFSYLGLSLWKTAETWRQAATWANGLEFLIPVLLSFGFMPFLYGWRIYLAYSRVFSTIAIFGIDRSLAPYAKWLAVTRIQNDLDLLDRWRRSIQLNRPADRVQLKASLTALLVLKAREASPPVVPPEEGWSPYLAIRFMTDVGVETGHYDQVFDDEWFAFSQPREIGGDAIISNAVSYFVTGDERAATTLKVKLNVNDPEHPDEAEAVFREYAMHLLEHAVSLDALKRLATRIASLEPFEAVIPFGSVTMTREDFTGGIRGGYSRGFEISRRAREAH